MMVRRDGGSADKKSAKSLPDPSRPGRSTSVFRAIRRLASPNSQYLACIAHSRELTEQLSVIGLVARPFAGKARGENARGAVERLDGNTGVVGEDEPVNRAAVMQRFLRGVLAEGPAVFDNRGEALHARNGFHFEATVRG